MSNDTPFTFPLPQTPNFTEAVTDPGLLPHEVSRIDSLWDSDNEERAAVSGGDESYVEDIRKSAVVPLMLAPENRWLFDRISALAFQVNTERYAFDILGIYEPLQLAEYNVGDFFQWHMDYGVGPTSCRKLSVTVQLSDPATYEGGDLQFMVNDNIVNAPRDHGSVTIFPSFVLHRVTPVTKGKRRSIVGWISGIPFR
jgi:PKHD-type hydroxylase